VHAWVAGGGGDAHTKSAAARTKSAAARRTPTTATII